MRTHVKYECTACAVCHIYMHIYISASLNGFLLSRSCLFRLTDPFFVLVCLVVISCLDWSSPTQAPNYLLTRHSTYFHHPFNPAFFSSPVLISSPQPVILLLHFEPCSVFRVSSPVYTKELLTIGLQGWHGHPFKNTTTNRDFYFSPFSILILNILAPGLLMLLIFSVKW